MKQAVKRKRFGPVRIRCMNEALRQRLNRLLFHGFSPTEVKKIMLCLFGCNIAIPTIKRHRRYLYSQVNETFKDFKERNRELKHGRGGYLPEWWLDLYQPPSEFPLPTSKTMKAKVETETEAQVPVPEMEYNRRKVKTLVGQPL